MRYTGQFIWHRSIRAFPLAWSLIHKSSRWRCASDGFLGTLEVMVAPPVNVSFDLIGLAQLPVCAPEHLSEVCLLVNARRVPALLAPKPRGFVVRVP